jgi:hypothetical protein
LSWFFGFLEILFGLQHHLARGGMGCLHIDVLQRIMKTLTTIFILTLVNSAWARILEPWDYGKLSASADIIVIAAPIKVKKTKESEALPGWSTRVSGVLKPLMADVTLSTFSVQTVLKGEDLDEDFVLRHLRVSGQKPKDRISINGPCFVSFDPKSNGCYLMFLKRLPNGQYVSITGQVDPIDGIKSLGVNPGRNPFKAEQDAGQSATAE